MGLNLIRSKKNNEVVLTVPPLKEENKIVLSVDFNSDSTVSVHFSQCDKRIVIQRPEAKLKRARTAEEKALVDDNIGNR